MAWYCLICEQPVEIIEPGDDDKACWPNLVGGHLEVTFGYGSDYDQCPLDAVYQSCICDKCVKKKAQFFRKVKTHCPRHWEVTKNDLY